MKISAEWLGEYVSLPPLEKLEDTLLMAGLGIEERNGDQFELEVTSNRGDWLSAIGIAREIGAMTGNRFRTPIPDVDEEGPSIEGRVSVEIENPLDCPRYVARLVEGVQIGPSPDWMQDRLQACGVRPINNVVDVTNYVMLEWGQPLHAFDYAKIPNGKIVVRRAKDGEKITTLDEVERDLSDQILVIADENNPIAVAGVMGGLDSEVTDSTVDILLESAYFRPELVRKGAHLLTLSSEASKRFERHVDPSGAKRAIDRAAQLLAQLGNGKVAHGSVDRYVAPITEAVVTLRPARCNAVLGLKIPVETQKELLARLGFKISENEGVIRAQIPTWRRDITREIDLIEEVARLYGYDRVEATLHTGSNTGAGRPLAGRLEDRARSACLRCGLTEVSTYSLSNQATHENAGVKSDQAVLLRNPLSEDYTLLRTSLIPSLLDVLKRNRGRRIRAFEIGRVYLTKGKNELADERRILGLALGDAPAQPHWQKNTRPVDFFALKAIVENVLIEFGAPALGIAATTNPSFHPGRCASISIGGAEIGIMGEIHPDIAEKFELTNRVYVAQIDFDALVRHVSLVRKYEPFSKYPPVDRDLALVVPENVTAASILDAARNAGNDLLESVQIFDIYVGPNIPVGFKSIAITMRFLASDRTLSQNEIETAVAAVLEAQVRLGAVLRG
jgi:phenylalanyl-tRNA synthetase beta chain